MPDETSALLSIGDMIDMAIGTPEVGVVDFNMLQMVLHCLAQQLRVAGKNVEVKSGTAPLPFNKENVQTIAITEYVLDPNDKATEFKLMSPPPPTTSDPDTILVVERVKKSDYIPPSSKGRGPELASGVMSGAVSGGGGSGGGGGGTTGAVSGGGGSSGGVAVSTGDGSGGGGSGGAVSGSGGAGSGGAASGGGGQAPQDLTTTTSAPKVSSIEKLSLVTVSKFNILENAVDDLKQRVYGSIPKNEDILEEVRSQTNLKAITDMWTSLNVSSRLEAAENGIAKISSLVEDLIADSTDLQQALKQQSLTRIDPTSAKSQAEPTPAKSQIDPNSAKSNFDATSAKSQIRPTSAKSQIPYSEHTEVDLESTNLTSALTAELEPTAFHDDLAIVHEHLKCMRADLDQLSDTFYNTMKVMNVDVDQPLERPAPVALATQESPKHNLRRSASNTELLDRLLEVEKQQRRCCELVAKSEGILQDQVNSLQDQLEILMKNQSLSTSQELTPDLVNDLKGLMQLFQTVQSMQEQLKQVHETALTLATEKEDRQQHINALLEQIELLKTIKLDREDMVEAMAEKADLRMLARKVSHDQFELACVDLAKGLEHAIGKLNVQESLWQQALDDIQREIETKLDKMELSPVKDFFNNKLKQLQENLKMMASLRREAEAAGTKRRLMRDVNCISCDAQAVMSMDPPMAMASKPLPVTHSMKPYLSYELDAIRKAQASNLPQRNLHDWENMDKQASQPKQPQKVRSETDKHLCNRYCGGSHTVTTPSQRVARLGHFIKQWGPDVLPLSSGLAAGDDGRMYKVSRPEDANIASGGAVEPSCTPKSPIKKSDTPKTPQKPVIIGECRCLDGDHP